MSGESDEIWVARQMGVDGGQEAVVPTVDATPVPEGDRKQDVNADETKTADEKKTPALRKQRYDRKVATGLSGLVIAAVVVVLIIAGLFYAGGCQSSGQAKGPRSVAEPAAVAATKPVPSRVVSPGTDRPLPYNADASKSCPDGGSTSAQTMAGIDPHNAFVCVRNGIDGQVITIDLDKCYVITAISLAPGWVGKDASGVDQWGQHRVVTIVQYGFNDTDRTLVKQETGNVHGDAVVPIKHVLASRLTMLIRQTSRPPATPQPTQTTGGGLSGILGSAAPTVAPSSTPDPLFAAPSTNSDPVDATFAISRLKIIGHEAM